MKKFKGFTLIEILIVVAIVSISFLGIIRGFLGIGEGLLNARHKTVATSLAQEKIGAMKQLSYFRLFVSTTTVGFDNVYFPPETYSTGKKEFTRSVLVRKVRELGSNLIVLSPGAVDEGLKQIKVQVEWKGTAGETKTFTLYNLRQNPDRTPLSGKITGTVRDKKKVDESKPDPEIGATVLIVENPNWRATSDESSGKFEIKTATGNWTVRASQKGYFSLQKSTSVSQGKTVDAGYFDLTPKTGKIITGLVISTTIPPVPIEGCVITCNDETSGATTSVSTDTHPTWNFKLISVSTGTWTVYATTAASVYGDVCGSTEGITLTVDSQFPDPCQIILSTDTKTGSISGEIVLSDGHSPEDDIYISAGTVDYQCTESNSYELEPVDEGLVTVMVNSHYFKDYTTETATVTVVAGENRQVDPITIQIAGSVSGIVYASGGDGKDPFQRIVITAVDNDGEGTERGAGISDKSGEFEITQLPIYPGVDGDEETYEIAPVLDEEDACIPESISVVITKGCEIKYCTFTITSAWGYVRGKVTDGGEPITTGVIIIASTGTISKPPPESNITINAGEYGKYGGISYSEGEYEIKVRRPDTYYVYAWYTEVNASGDGTETSRIGPENADLTDDTTAWVEFKW